MDELIALINKASSLPGLKRVRDILETKILSLTAKEYAPGEMVYLNKPRNHPLFKYTTIPIQIVAYNINKKKYEIQHASQAHLKPHTYYVSVECISKTPVDVTKEEYPEIYTGD